MTQASHALGRSVSQDSPGQEGWPNSSPASVQYDGLQLRTTLPPPVAQTQGTTPVAWDPIEDITMPSGTTTINESDHAVNAESAEDFANKEVAEITRTAASPSQTQTLTAERWRKYF